MLDTAAVDLHVAVYGFPSGYREARLGGWVAILIDEELFAFQKVREVMVTVSKARFPHQLLPSVLGALRRWLLQQQ